MGTELRSTQDGPSRKGGGGQEAAPNAPPAITLPKGGGAIRGIGEKFATNPVTGTGSVSVPIPTSPGRSGFGPQLSLTYDSNKGNGPFGIGWHLGIPNITRKTDKGLPRYRDGEESDVFVLSDSEDLVPVFRQDDNGDWMTGANGDLLVDEFDQAGYHVRRYRPRIEGLFARIERWTALATGEVHWRSITGDNITTHYGKSAQSRIADPEDPARVFSWLMCETYDDKGNAIVYEYASENDENVNHSLVNEHSRIRSANRYLKRITYGNRVPRTIQPDLAQQEWMFEVVFDYGEGHYHDLDPDPALPEADQHRYVRSASGPDLPWDSAQRAWPARPDPFSSFRAGFEVRTHRRCCRVLTFHRFAELGDEPYLIRSTEFGYADLDLTQPVAIDDELAYPGSTRFASFIRTVTQSGFVRDDTHAVVEENSVTYVTYLRKSLPPLEFEYGKASIQDDVHVLDEDSLENLPDGLDGGSYQWVDLDGEGVSGILAERDHAWYYKRNLSPVRLPDDQGGEQPRARFAPLEMIAVRPGGAFASGQAQLIDLSGDGQLDLANFTAPVPGFFERTDDQDWEPFRSFRELPNLGWDNPNMRFVDLTGDGHADILLTEESVLTCYPSLAEDGFGPAMQVRQPPEEETGARLLLADGSQSIYLADMSGDGLTDLVRIRNGEVCYWPNLGYGRFGVKVIMDNPPWLDTPDQFSQQRMRLADIDGSGVTDIIYLGRDGVRLYFNQSGNAWSEPRYLKQFPQVDNLTSVMVTDLLGNGMACLCWSSPLPGHSGQQMRYVDLLGSQKPYLLTRLINNLGAETRIQYAPSTKFYLADKFAGKPWITKIPFPVHVVERVETTDRINNNRFVSRHAYHHGYFDGVEREFRGFGMVEQWDTEEIATLDPTGTLPPASNLEPASHVPPALTRTWFHTGVFVDRDHISNFYAGLLDADDIGEYYREPGLTDDQARQLLLDDTVLPPGLSASEEREACRALKGSMLRQEVYALDDSDKAQHPYSVIEQNYAIRPLQPRAQNPYGVFFTNPLEAIRYHYEREPADPRISHVLALETDAYGNTKKLATVGYGRRKANQELPLQVDRDRQTQTLVTYTENGFTNAVSLPGAYRTPLPCETRTYELTGYTPTGPAGRFRTADFAQPDPADPHGWSFLHVFDNEIDYTDSPSGGRERRLIEAVRTVYRPDDLGTAQNDPLALLPLATIETLALPGDTYRLAFTDGLLARVYQRKMDGQPPENLLPAPASVLPADLPGGQTADRGGYVDLDGDGRWWVPSGRVLYSPGLADSAAIELAYAAQHYFLPCRYRGPFGETTTISYDQSDLMLVKTLDPAGNVVTVETEDDTGHIEVRNDYRVLRPYWVTDPNRNRTLIAYDALGLTVGTASMGKPSQPEGDTLTGFEANLTDAVILDHLAHPLADPHAILQGAASRLVYDLFAYYRTRDQPEPQPCVVYTLVRETHQADLAPGAQSRVQHSFFYSDGFGREIQKKIQAEPGPAPKRDPQGSIIVGMDGQPVLTDFDQDPRWVGSGWTVFNNKGKPIRQYEPFFTDTHRFEFDVRIGVSPVIFYDPIERTVALLHPNHAWEKIVFDSWQQVTWDVNDTALVADPKTDPDAGGFFRRLPDADYLPTWYAPRQDGSLGPREQTAAQKTAIHANTPTYAHSDSLGRTFLTIAHNRYKHSSSPPAAPPIEDTYPVRVTYDIEGNQREVSDAKDRIVARYDYDMLGKRVYQSSMDSGERWTLDDVTGKTIREWDSRLFLRRMTYDALRRPLDLYVSENGVERLAERTVYGEAQGDALNHRIRVYQSFDAVGRVTNLAYDFKGNLLQSQRDLLPGYHQAADWNQQPDPNDGSYVRQTTYDAINRPVTLVSPHSAAMPPSTIRLSYNEANLLEKVEANLRGAAVAETFVADIDYDAWGRRTLVRLGNGVSTAYEYDPLTSHLVHLLTWRDAAQFPDDCPDTPPAGWPGCQVQNLSYTYDPAGNVIQVHDDAQQTIYFRNQRVEPDAEYTYDGVYQLIEATGREHVGQTAGGAPLQPSWPDYSDAPRVGLAHPGDGHAMGTYAETYQYDNVGNILTIAHAAASGSWTRAYAYNEPSQIEPGHTNNRLSATTVGSATETYTYDAHGNLTAMPHLAQMDWDFENMLQRVDLGGGGTAYYGYDASGQRTRKVIERQNGTRQKERIYFDEFEIYREFDGAGVTVTLERETLHISELDRTVALVETRTQGDDGSPAQLIRYQLHNHLGSASLELDGQARIISYEEYYPYGSTSYQAVDKSIKAAARRYRYTGKERDEETGLTYYGARYYAQWLARWTSADPIGLQGGPNLYAYVRNNPVRLIDPRGMADDPPPPTEPGFTDYLKVMFIITTHQTPEEFGKGMVDKLNRVTGVIDLYGPGGMLDKAGQKLEQGIVEGKFDTVKVTEEEHQRWGHSIVSFGGSLFPGVGPTKTVTPGPPAVVAGTDILVPSLAEATVPNLTRVPAVAMSIAGQGSGGKSSDKKSSADKSSKESDAGKKAADKTKNVKTTTKSKGPGSWKTDFNQGHGMSKEAAQYQEQISGHPASEGYYVNGRQFDGYDEVTGKLLDAKYFEDEGRFGKAIEKMNKGNFSDKSYLMDKGTDLLEQARAQVKVAKGVPIEWHVAGETSATALRRAFKAWKIPIKVVHTPYIPK